MASETTTPNIGLQIAAFNQSNWQVPTNFNWNKLDLIFGGQLQVPALDVANFTVANIAALLTPWFKSEQPAGAIPGSVYTLSYAPALLFGIYQNGLLLRPVLDYTLNGNVVTLAAATTAPTDTMWAIYLWEAAEWSGTFPVPSGVASGLVVVPWSTTPVFDASEGLQFNITLTGNIVNSLFINGAIGPTVVVMTIVQDGTGGRTFVWPSNMRNGGVVDTDANSTSTQMFAVNADGSANAVSPMMYS